MPSITLLFMVFLCKICWYEKCSFVEATAGHDSVKLINKIFTNYRREFLPQANLSEPVKVEFKFELVNIKDVNAREQTVTIYGWVNQQWRDPLLRWDPTQYGGLEEMQVSSDKIWVPDILLYNNVDELDRLGGGTSTYKTSVIIRSDGMVRWPCPALFIAICTIDVTEFPFDSQECRLKFGSWTQPSNKIQMIAMDIPLPSDNYMPSGEWRLVNLYSESNTVYYETANTSYDDVTIVFKIGRNFINYCVTLIIPCFVISCMIFLSFVLPPESGERVGLSMTVLLAMTVFQQLTSSIFPSYDFPLLGQYYLATSIEMSLSLVATAMVINFSYRRETEMPAWMRKLFLEWLSRVVCLRDTVKNSRPKPRKRRSFNRPKQESTKRPQKKEISESTVSQRLSINQTTISSDHQSQANGDIANIESKRREDRLVEEFRKVLLFSNSVISPESQKENGPGIYNQAVELEDAEIQCDDEPHNETRTRVLGENGELLSEEELTLRHWEWGLAARILDRLFMWVAIIVGIITVFAIFFRAKRLQQLFH